MFDRSRQWDCHPLLHSPSWEKDASTPENNATMPFSFSTILLLSKQWYCCIVKNIPLPNYDNTVLQRYLSLMARQ